jgi:hypothetical protein
MTVACCSSSSDFLDMISISLSVPFHSYIAHELKWARIATGYGLDCRGSIPNRGTRFFSTHNAHNGSGAHPASYPVGAG